MSGGGLRAISVVIPTAGGRAEMLDGMLAVLLGDPATGEVIVCFDAEDPRTRAVTDSHGRSDDRVRTVSTEEGARAAGSRGQAAREAGAKVAEGEVVLALDDDLDPEPGLVSGHARRHASGDQALVVVGYSPVVYAEGVRQAAPVRLYDEAYERASSGFLDGANVLEGLWGGHFSLRRSLWLGLEPSALELEYHDDREFGIRLLEAGAHGVFDPELRAGHQCRRTAAGLARDAVGSGRAQARLHAAYPDRIRPPRQRQLVRPLAWLSRTRPAWRLLSATLAGAGWVLGTLRLDSAADATAKLLWRIGFERGVRTAERS